MALTESQIIDCLTILGLPVRSDVTYALAGESNKQLLYDSELSRRALSMLNADQETKVVALIAQWTAIQYDTDLINAQGLNSNPERARGRLAYILGNLIGYQPPSRMGGLKIGRG